jgi:hypothetical protein
MKLPGRPCHGTGKGQRRAKSAPQLIGMSLYDQELN